MNDIDSRSGIVTVKLSQRQGTLLLILHLDFVYDFHLQIVMRRMKHL